MFLDNVLDDLPAVDAQLNLGGDALGFGALLADVEALTAAAILGVDAVSETLSEPLLDGSAATVAAAGSPLESAVFSLLSQATLVVPFSEGRFAVDIPTELGAVTGGIDFAGGDLNLDLTTPAGRLTLDYDFPIDAAFPFTVASPSGPLDGSVDLASGQVIVPLEISGISLGAISINLDELSGTVAVQNGVALLSVGLTDPTVNPGFFGLPETVTAEIDLGPVASQLVEGVTAGPLSAAAEVATSAVDGSLDILDMTVSILDLATATVDSLIAITGSLTVDGGNVAATLETPLGAVGVQATVAQVEDVLTSLSLI